MNTLVLLTLLLSVRTATAASSDYVYADCSDPLESRVDRIVDRRVAFLRDFPIETAPGQYPSPEQIRRAIAHDRDFAALAKARGKFDSQLRREQKRFEKASSLSRDLAAAAAKIDPTSREIPFWRWWKHAPLLVRVAFFRKAYLVVLPSLLVGQGIPRRTEAVLRSMADDFATLAEAQEMVVRQTEAEGDPQIPPVERIVERIRKEIVFRRE